MYCFSYHFIVQYLIHYELSSSVCGFYIFVAYRRESLTLNWGFIPEFHSACYFHIWPCVLAGDCLFHASENTTPPLQLSFTQVIFFCYVESKWFTFYLKIIVNYCLVCRCLGKESPDCITMIHWLYVILL